MTPDRSTTTRQQQLERTLANPLQAGVFHLPATGPADIIQAAHACDFNVFRIDLSYASDKTGLLTAIARDMQFPADFGCNWDALADYLGDLSWCPAEGHVVILEHSDAIHSQAQDDFLTVLDILAAAAEEWRERGCAFWCLVDMQADGLAWLPGL